MSHSDSESRKTRASKGSSAQELVSFNPRSEKFSAKESTRGLERRALLSLCALPSARRRPCHDCTEYQSAGGMAQAALWKSCGERPRLRVQRLKNLVWALRAKGPRERRLLGDYVGMCESIGPTGEPPRGVTMTPYKNLPEVKAPPMSERRG